MQENTFCSQTKFLLVELRSHEVGRHLNRDTHIYTSIYPLRQGLGAWEGVRAAID
jgi:hypothetical protein